jgi:hypothetical protein
MELNFIIITDKYTKIRSLDNFGPTLHSLNIFSKFQVIHIVYDDKIGKRQEYPHLHLIIKNIPSVFCLTNKGLENLQQGQNLNIRDIRLFQGMLINRHTNVDGTLVLLPVVEKQVVRFKKNNLLQWVVRLK